VFVPETGTRKKDEMRFTFDVTKCDKFFDVLLQHNIIRLKEGHVIPLAKQLVRKNSVSGIILFST
jgi:hypothetical protein